MFLTYQKTRLSNRAEQYKLDIDFSLNGSNDVICKGGDIVAYWNEYTQSWEPKDSLYAYAKQFLDQMAKEELANHPDQMIIVANPMLISSGASVRLEKFIKALPESPVLFNQKIIWKGDPIEKRDYSTVQMPYSLVDAPCPCYDALMSVLYNPEDRTMLEWVAGAALCNEGGKIEKFVYLEGDPGSGKSTFLNILSKVVGPYGKNIRAEGFVSSSDGFATAELKDAPLVGIQHDGDLSKVEQNVVLNNIVSHEPVRINDKYSKAYYMRMNMLMFIASNEPLRLTSSNSGLLRRCLDPVPTGKLLPREKYDTYMAGIDDERGAIANRFISVYKELGPRIYGPYKSSRLVKNGNQLGYWVQRERDSEWHRKGECLLSDEYAMYNESCVRNNVKNPMSKAFFERQLAFFWNETSEEELSNGVKDVHYIGYSWHTRKFTKPIFSLYQEENTEEVQSTDWLDFKSASDSSFEASCADCPAQYAGESGFPRVKWENCETKLKGIISTELHYVQVPSNHIVIDLDLRDEVGNKSADVNIAKVRSLGLPPTYAEYSKSGNGVHLHYIYTGDVDKLARVIEDNVEIKVFAGNASLRRRFTRGNNLPIATIHSGLPYREKPTENADYKITSEDHLKRLIRKGLKGEYGSHIVTVKFIDHVVRKTYDEGAVQYDISNMFDEIADYGNCSHNHANECRDIIRDMPLRSKVYEDSRPIAFFDMEVYRNYNCFCWMRDDSDDVATERFPSSEFLRRFFQDYRAIGYNNKGYDNEIAECIINGGTPQETYRLSKAIITKSPSHRPSRRAKNLSFTDIFDFSNVKQSLKKWELQLGIHHQECCYPWDEDLPEEAFEAVEGYCRNDVRASKAVFHANQADWNARLALLAMVRAMYGDAVKLNENSSTNEITAGLIFGGNKDAKREFVYTDLSVEFPGYTYEKVSEGKIESYYRHRKLGEGGLVIAVPGYHENVGVEDVASMHPSSAIALNVFGPRYTRVYRDLVKARKACKHESFEEMSENVFEPAIRQLVDAGKTTLKALSKSLKIPINAVYGETSAKFDNPFKDPRNVDNIVAKRGALMIAELFYQCNEKGFHPVHVKTDSIKLPNFTKEMQDFVIEFGKKYQYEFELEEFYSVFLLKDNAQYVAFNTISGKWEARGALFSPYVMKTLFTHEPYVPEDFAINKSTAKNPIYLGDAFVGKNVNVAAVKDGCECKSKNADGKMSYVAGTKGYKWIEFEELVSHENWQDELDMTFYDSLTDKAKEVIEEYIPFEAFVANAARVSYDDVSQYL